MASKKTQRKTQRMSKTKRHYCRNPATMYTLNKWTEKMLEKLGWMVLAKSKGGMADKIYSYKKSLKRLHDHLECKILEVNEEDRITDLKIMLQNVKILKAHSDKVL